MTFAMGGVPHTYSRHIWITTNWKILKEIGIPDHLTCLLRNLYAGQEATVRTLGYMCLFELWFSQGISVVGLLSHMVVLFLIFYGVSMLFSTVTVSIYIPTRSAKGFPFFHILSSIYYL